MTHPIRDRRSSMMKMALVLVVVALQGCSTLRPKLEPIRLMIVSVGMTSPDMFSQQFLVRMHVENSNDREIAVKGVDYKLMLQGDFFAEGVSSRGFTLPAKGEQDVDLPVRTAFSASFGRLISRLNGGKRVEYVIEGTLLTDISMLKKIAFRESGTAELTVMRQ